MYTTQSYNKSEHHYNNALFHQKALHVAQLFAESAAGPKVLRCWNLLKIARIQLACIQLLRAATMCVCVCDDSRATFHLYKFLSYRYTADNARRHLLWRSLKLLPSLFSFWSVLQSFDIILLVDKSQRTQLQFPFAFADRECLMLDALLFGKSHTFHPQYFCYILANLTFIHAMNWTLKYSDYTIPAKVHYIKKIKRVKKYWKIIDHQHSSMKFLRLLHSHLSRTLYTSMTERNFQWERWRGAWMEMWIKRERVKIKVVIVGQKIPVSSWNDSPYIYIVRIYTLSLKRPHRTIA